MTIDEQKSRNMLWAMLYGNFLIGTGVLLPAGMLNQLSVHFSQKPTSTAVLMTISGVVVGLGAPIVAGLASKVDRRVLLVAALALYVFGHTASAFTNSFQVLEVLRALTVVGAAIFTPQAAATLGVLLPPDKRPGAISFIFIGWSVAAVLGVPAGNLLADIIGWQMVYLLMGVLSAVGLLWIWQAVPAKVFTPPLSLASWGEVLSNPVLSLVLLVTLISFVGQFHVFSYLAPILVQGFGATSAQVSLGFGISGFAGVIGNYFASRMALRLGVENVIAGGLLLIALGMLILALGFGIFGFAVLAFAFVGSGNFVSNSLQQSRLAQIAPPLAAATIALNTSCVYLGQGLGTWLGGKALDATVSPRVAVFAASFAALALAVSLIAQRMRT